MDPPYVISDDDDSFADPSDLKPEITDDTISISSDEEPSRNRHLDASMDVDNDELPVVEVIHKTNAIKNLFPSKNNNKKIEQSKKTVVKHLFPSNSFANDVKTETPTLPPPSVITSMWIESVEVMLPVQPYGSQLALMAKIIKGIKESKNCILESPTGSGKTLALLCGVLAWQHNEYKIMGRKKGTHYQCINKRKRSNVGLERARQVLGERSSNQLNTTSSSTMSGDVDYSITPGTSKENVPNRCPPVINLDSNDVFEIESNKNPPVSSLPIEGRRIVDFNYFFDQWVSITNHSDQFGCNASNLMIKGEKVQGFSSTFSLLCSMCGSQFLLKTCKDNTNELDVNHSAVSGVISIGCGRSNLNELAASINLPLMSITIYQKCHDNLFNWWKTTAEATMIEAGKKEASMALESGSLSPSGIPTIAVTADAAWGKRSYKNNFSSAAGVGAIIGIKTGKILHVGVKNKYCVICSRAANKNIPPPEHQCNKNHTGSSTSMEKSVIVEGFKKSVETHNLVYAKLIADGDSSVYKNILESRPYSNVTVEKIECSNHLMRNYNGKNLSLMRVTSIPIKERKLLTSDRMNRLRIAVKAAVRYRSAQNVTFTEQIKNLQKDIINSPKHIFGDHTNCERYYCTEEKRTDRNLVTEGKALMFKLMTHATLLSYNARSLLQNLNNNRAEQFNAIVAKHVGGKRINYSLKNSYALRCYAAVVAFNTGKPISTFYEINFNKSPSMAAKKYETQKRNLNKKKKQVMKPQRRLVFDNSHIDYGNSCQKPDLTDEQFNSAKASFLENLSSQVELRHEVERDTILQAESALWLELRRCLLTASNFAKVCKRRKNISSAGLVKNLLYKYSLDHVAAIQHGKSNEENALIQLQRQENIVLEKCGLFIDDKHFFLGATPDAVFKNGIVELKCPFSAFGMCPDDAIRGKKITFWKIQNDNIIVNKNHDWWWYQIQGQLHITKKDVCLFAVWTGSDYPLKVQRITRDDSFWKTKMEERLVDFYHKCLLPEIVDPRKSRSMPLRDTTF